MSMKVLIRIVTELTGVSSESIRGPGRLKHMAHARSVVFWVACRTMRKTHSVHAIGREINRDHSTVLCSFKKAELRRESDLRYRSLTDDTLAMYVLRREEQRTELKAACHRLALELRS